MHATDSSHPSLPASLARGLLCLGLLAVLMAGLLLGIGRLEGPRAARGAEPTVEPTGAIFSAQDAIERSLAHLPDGAAPTDVTARLTAFAEVDQWRQTSSPGIEGHAPAWLVGIRAAGMLKYDVLGPFISLDAQAGDEQPTDLNLGLSALNTPVDGAFYVWDANGGYVVGAGVLVDGTALTFDSLSAVPDSPLPIVQATPFVLPAAQAGPTP